MKKFLFLFFTILFLINISYSQIYYESFNQTSTINITGIADVINQNEIDQRINVNEDNLTWNVREAQIPFRKIKTVEYFIYQDMTQMAANTEKIGSFTVYIPEKNPIIRSAIIEIKNLVYNAQISAGQTVKLSNGTTNVTLLTTAAGPSGSGENMFYTFLVNATEAFKIFINGSGNYNFILYVKFNTIRQGENAKLILTYEYDSDSEREIKTVRFFVGQLTSTLAVGSSTNFIIPPLNLPERNVVIRDSFFETYIHLQPGGTVDEGISIDLDGSNAISGTPIDNAGATTIDYVFLYKNIFDPSTSHTFNFKPTAGYALHTVGTELVLTYEYDSNSELQLKTVRYLVGQDGGLYTSPHTANFIREIILPETNISIINAYNRITFAIAYGSGAGTTAYTTTIGVNSSIFGTTQPRVDYTLGLRDEQVSTSMILYNASGLYSITNGTQIICSVYSSAATTSYYTGSKGCELILTYVYNASSSTFLNSVEYFVGSSYHQALATSTTFPFSFIISEPNYNFTDAYLSVYGFTGSTTTGTNTLVSYVNVPGYTSQTCNFRNTGEARSDFCWDYVMDNITYDGLYNVVVSSGVTRWFSSKLTVTYLYKPNYKFEVEHNSTISFRGILRNISIMINFTLENSKNVGMSVYNFKLNQWNSSLCPTILAFANQFNVFWCNISSSPEDYVSPENKIVVRFYSFGNNNITIFKEEYVQFFITYEYVNKAPLISNATELPSSPTVYQKGNKYTFKVFVTDENGEEQISLVIFEFEGQNQTVSNYNLINSTTREYWIEKEDLPANPSGYNIRWYAKDVEGAWSNVLSRIYIINKGNPNIEIYFSDTNVDYPTETNVTCYIIEGDSFSILNLYRNDTLISSNFGFASEVSILGAGVYNYSCEYLETQNYTSTYVNDRYLYVNKGIPKIKIEINGLENDYYGYYPTETNVTAWLENLYNEGEIILYRNQTYVGKGILVAEKNILPAGIYDYSAIFEETQNYTSYFVSRIVTIYKGISKAYLILIPESPIEYGEQTVAVCYEDNPEAEGRLWRNYTDVTHENNTAVILPAGIWYYECNVSETQNYTSASNSSIYLVNRALSKIRLFLNDTEGNKTYIYEDYANITATLNIPDKEFYIEANFTGLTEIIGYGSNTITILTNNFGAGVYNITAYWFGDQNYTSDSVTYFMFVNKKPTTLYLWINNTRENKNYYSNVTLNLTIELLGYSDKLVELWSNYSDGEFKRISYGYSPHQSILFLDRAGIFNYTGYYPGNTNYTESLESWIIKIGKMNSSLDYLNPKIVGEDESSLLIASCECYPLSCSNVYIEAQSNGTVIPTVNGNITINGSNPYFLDYLDGKFTIVWNLTSNKVGTYEIRIKCNSTEFSDVFSEIEILNVIDKKAPYWFNNVSYPINATYRPMQNYHFNISWIDNTKVEQVLIEHNFTGILINETMEKNGENGYYYFISDLAAGTYVWKSYARDSYGNWNVSDEFIYIVEKSPTQIFVYVNGSDEDRDFEVYDTINITAMLNVSNKIIYLDSNITDWVLQYGESLITNITKLNYIGVYNITAYWFGDQNYTSSSKSIIIRVLDTKKPQYLEFGQSKNWIGVNETINLYAVWSDNYELDYAWLSTNETGIWKNTSYIKFDPQTKESIASFTWRNASIPAGSVIAWKIYVNDTSGNENLTPIFVFYINASQLWNFTTSGRIFSSPAIGDVNNDGIIDVVLASMDNKVYVLRGNDGSLIFTFSTNGNISSSPSLVRINNEPYLRIFVGSYDNNLYAINGSNGQKIWNFTTSGRIFSSPAIGDVNNDGIIDVVFGSDDNKVYAVNSINGELVWSFQTLGRVVSSPSLRKIGNTVFVFVGSYDNNLYAINGSNGQKIWNFTARDKIESSPLIDDLDYDG
ncbi:MAG: PQQ-binding-like beta-propeller repeat protein, partial [Candidatus Aenigmatarchaeota archaeon]